MKEIWKDIENYEGHYQVSNLGRVKSFKKQPYKILKQTQNTDGYLVVDLCKNGKEKVTKVHRLVANAFINNLNNKPTVNHINGIKDDNRLENLEFATRSENTQHAYNTGLKNAKSIMKKVEISKEGITLQFESSFAASRYIGCKLDGVSRVANQNRYNKSIYGWSAKYIKEETNEN